MLQVQTANTFLGFWVPGILCFVLLLVYPANKYFIEFRVENLAPHLLSLIWMANFARILDCRPPRMDYCHTMQTLRGSG